MTDIRTAALPASALLAAYARDGGYTDCFVTETPHAVSHPQYVAAFYTTWVFQLERFILKWLVRRPSTDEQVRQLAEGADADFAAWSVERRADNQLLLCDYRGRTRSWLMVEPLPGSATRLYFGSAVVPRPHARPAGSGLGLLLRFHTIYSRILLRAARTRLERQTEARRRPA